MTPSMMHFMAEQCSAIVGDGKAKVAGSKLLESKEIYDNPGVEEVILGAGLGRTSPGVYLTGKWWSIHDFTTAPIRALIMEAVMIGAHLLSRSFQTVGSWQLRKKGMLLTTQKGM